MNIHYHIESDLVGVYSDLEIVVILMLKQCEGIQFPILKHFKLIDSKIEEHYIHVFRLDGKIKQNEEGSLKKFLYDENQWILNIKNDLAIGDLSKDLLLLKRMES